MDVIIPAAARISDLRDWLLLPDKSFTSSSSCSANKHGLRALLVQPICP